MAAPPSWSEKGRRATYNVAPGEIIKVTLDGGVQQLLPPNPKSQICSFLWIYYGYPAADYEGINVEETRYNEGCEMGKQDRVDIDYVSAIPDSGIGMALGYSNERKVPYKRGVVKYTPTWSRSFMPVNQSQREHVAKMKLIPNRALLEGKKVAFCDDSIVRGMSALAVRLSIPQLLGLEERHGAYHAPMHQGDGGQRRRQHRQILRPDNARICQPR